MIEWDGCPDIQGWEKGGEGPPQELKDSLFNKDRKNAWRIDVGVELCPEENKGSDGDGSLNKDYFVSKSFGAKSEPDSDMDENETSSDEESEEESDSSDEESSESEEDSD